MANGQEDFPASCNSILVDFITANTELFVMTNLPEANQRKRDKWTQLVTLINDQQTGYTATVRKLNKRWNQEKTRIRIKAAELSQDLSDENRLDIQQFLSDYENQVLNAVKTIDNAAKAQPKPVTAGQRKPKKMTKMDSFKRTSTVERRNAEPIEGTVKAAHEVIIPQTQPLPDWYHRLTKPTKDRIRLCGYLHFPESGHKTPYIYIASKSIQAAAKAAIQVLEKAWAIEYTFKQANPNLVCSIDTDPISALSKDSHAIARVFVEAARYLHGWILTHGETGGDVELIGNAVYRSNAHRLRQHELPYSSIPCIGMPRLVEAPGTSILTPVTQEIWEKRVTRYLNGDHTGFIFFNYRQGGFGGKELQRNIGKRLSRHGSGHFLMSHYLTGAMLLYFFLRGQVANENESWISSVKQFNHKDSPLAWINDTPASQFTDAVKLKQALLHQLWLDTNESPTKRITQGALRLCLIWQILQTKRPWYLEDMFKKRDLAIDDDTKVSNALKNIIGQTYCFIVDKNQPGFEIFLHSNTTFILTSSSPNKVNCFHLRLYRRNPPSHAADLLEAINVNKPESLEAKDLRPLLKRFCKEFPIKIVPEGRQETLAYFKLFIYAIFYNRFPYLTDFCLQNGGRPLTFALIGTWLADRLHKYFNKRNDHKMTNAYDGIKTRFVTHVKGMLEIAASGNFFATSRLLQTTPWHRPTKTYIELVDLTKTPELFAQRNIERYVMRSWKQNRAGNCGFAPRTKFAVHALSHIAFLGLYIWVVLFSRLDKDISNGEVILWILQAFPALFLATSYGENNALSDKCNSLQRRIKQEKWLLLDIASLFILVPICILRVKNFGTAGSSVAIVLLCTNFILQSFKLIKYLLIFKRIGPKALILLDMAGELIFFAIFFAIFLLMFSVSTYRLAHGQSEVTLDIFGTLPRRGLWEIFGQLDEAVYSGNISNCTGIESASFDCKFRSAAIIVLMTVYLFMTTILLVNLLIAANTKIFENANDQAENSWRYNMYLLLRTYQTKAILPWPFAFVENWFIGGYIKCKKLIAQIVSTKKKAESDDVEKQELLERKVEPCSATFEKANDDMQEFAPMKQLDADIFERDIGAEYFARLKARQ